MEVSNNSEVSTKNANPLSIFAVIATNILGYFLGIVVFSIIFYLSALVFGYIAAIPLINQIISYPVSPEYYVTVAVYSLSSIFAINTCNFICKKGKHNIKYGNIVFGATLVITAIFFFVVHANTFGFFEQSEGFFGYSAMLIAGGATVIAGFYGEGLNE